MIAHAVDVFKICNNASINISSSGEGDGGGLAELAVIYM